MERLEFIEMVVVKGKNYYIYEFSHYYYFFIIRKN